MTHKTPERTPVADIALRRARADFLEMPGLQLTPAQARRLWMLEADDCEAVLAELLATNFIRRSDGGPYVRTA